MKDDERRAVIVTFKRKDERADRRRDKVDILRAHCKTSDIKAQDVGLLSALGVEPVEEPAVLALDINEYEAPIVSVSLTDKEIAALEADKDNIASVEEDGLCYALRDETELAGGVAEAAPTFLVEGQPAPLAETIPWGINRIDAERAWNVTRGQGIKVAVLDTGIDYRHPDLTGNVRGGISFVPTETSIMDFHGHGTHCAGTIGARINGAGVIGVAPCAYLYGVKVLSVSLSGNWSWLIAGIQRCIRTGMDVLSMSLGGSAAPSALEAICEVAFARGLVLVAAAGNSGGAVGEPARYDSVIAVSAIDAANQLAGFSSRGPEVELCAPGVDVLSTWPGGAYKRDNGTSMACPHVSGAAALAISSHRYARNVTIRSLLAWTADDMGNPGRDPLFGFGVVDAEQAAFERRSPRVATNPWHSVLSDVHHTNADCNTGNNIEIENRREGTGGKPLCQECAG